jgi:succinate-semialdehyde dehydrogenase/glutarate-semialdehyde dehydrogenase
MYKASDVLLAKTNELAKLMTMEMGKPIQQSKSEIEKCALVCRYYADNAEDFLKNEYIQTKAQNSYIAHRPLGIVLAVMPWNFPFWQVFRFAAPALMAGNAGLLKHASNVVGCALEIEKIFKEAGFPENIFRTLKISGKDVASVIEQPDVKAVTLTGSVKAGQAVAKKAGEQLKKSVMELGGSDPYIVLEDADLEKAAETCVASRLINSGQSCIAAKRFIIVEKIFKQFEEIFTEKMKQKTMGDPMDENTDIGPQAQEGLRDELHNQVVDSVGKGARCILGGKIPDKKGAWYPATVLKEVTPGMPVFDEETFGPVAALIRAKDEQDAVRLANNTVFGLGAAVFSEDVEHATQIAEKQINAGCCFVNDFVKSDPRMPFGGVGMSGFGRELSYLGIKEFVNTKTIWVK